MVAGRQVLSLDWDFFTGDCQYDVHGCGWSCCGTYGFGQGGSVELGRGDSSLTEDLRKPESRIQELLKHPFTIGETVVAECHASIVSCLKDYDRVRHLDFHADDMPYEWSGGFDSLVCGNWVEAAYHRLPHVRIQHYSKRGPKKYPDHYDLVFVCKSSPWTPPEFDGLFHQLITSLAQRSQSLRFFGHRGRTLRREHSRLSSKRATLG